MLAAARVLKEQARTLTRSTLRTVSLYIYTGPPPITPPTATSVVREIRSPAAMSYNSVTLQRRRVLVPQRDSVFTVLSANANAGVRSGSTS